MKISKKAQNLIKKVKTLSVLDAYFQESDTSIEKSHWQAAKKKLDAAQSALESYIYKLESNLTEESAQVLSKARNNYFKNPGLEDILDKLKGLDKLKDIKLTTKHVVKFTTKSGVNGLFVKVPEEFDTFVMMNYAFAGTWVMEKDSKLFNHWKINVPQGKYEILDFSMNMSEVIKDRLNLDIPGYFLLLYENGISVDTGKWLVLVELK